MFTKAGLLIALLLVYLGYRWGSGKAQALSRPAPQPAPVAPPQAATPPAPPKKEILSVKVLLGIAIVLLIIAILSSLQR